MALVGATIARGEPHRRALEWLGVEPPASAFDAPALAPGMVAVHVRRGPWGYLHEPPAAAIRVRSLEELPALLAGASAAP
jgi:hypothetical protein